MKEAGPRFSAAARTAAAVKRRERSRLAAENFNEPMVFALRAPAPQQGYIWEIRKFGGVSMERGGQCYATAAEARQAGLKVIESQKQKGAAIGCPNQRELAD